MIEFTNDRGELLQYELRYNLKSIETIENILGESVLSIMNKTQGMFSITQLRTLVGNALFTTEGTKVSPQQGMAVVEQIINTQGVIPLCGLVAQAIQRDCPFFFQVG